MFKSKVGWNFPSNDGGQENGLNDPGVETFKDRPLVSLAREVLQNSSDASDNATKRPVEVHFELLDMPADEFPGINDFRKALKACGEYSTARNLKSDAAFFERAKKTASAKAIPVLRISDYNTTGLLVGSKDDKSSDWFRLTKSIGVSGKHEGKLGSFGIGKHAPFACSDLRTVLYATRDKTGAEAFQGVAKLVSHERDGKIALGPGYFGVKEGNYPLQDFSKVERFRRERTGADIYVMGFHSFEDWESRVVKSVIESFFLAVHQGSLRVQVGKVKISNTSLPKLIKEHYRERDSRYFADEYYQVLTRSGEGASYEEEDFDGYGAVSLKLLKGEEFKKKVAMFRRSGMKIFDKANFHTPVRFAGVLEIRGLKLDALLRSMEPPSHDKWEPSGRSDDPDKLKEQQRIYRSLVSWMHECVRKMTAVEAATELDAEGMSEFLPDDLNDELSGSPLHADEDVQSEPAEELKIWLRPAPTPGKPAPVGSKGEEDKGAGDAEGEEESDPLGDDNEPGVMQKARHAAGGNEADSGPELGRRVELKTSRSYHTNPAEGRYSLVLEVGASEMVRLRVRIVGEVGSERANLARYSVDGGPELPAQGTIIGPMQLLQDRRTPVEIVFAEPIRCALEVFAYAD